MIMPKVGTPEFDNFMRRARDPNSVEGHIIRQMNEDASNQIQNELRQKLHLMIDVVPGQLFRDIGRFHDKFKLEATDDPGYVLPDDVLLFRLGFLLEELLEYAESVGFYLSLYPRPGGESVSRFTFRRFMDGSPNDFKVEKAFDALIDLTYVTLGTAFLHRFPFNAGWDRVQAANMAKVRAEGADDERSHRKHSADVVKPEGWQPPVLSDLLFPPSKEVANDAEPTADTPRD